MPRAVILALLFGVAAAPPARPPRQDAPPAPKPDATPSDPAAVGFLTGVVDRRLYSLEGAGAGKLVATVRATFEGRADAPPPFDFEIACDYATGSTTTRPLGEIAEAVKPLMGGLYGYGHAVVGLLPSRSNSAFVLTLARDGDLMRLDYKPRSANALEKSRQEWYRADGTPVRRKMTTAGFDGKPIEREVTEEYSDVDGQLLLKEQRPTDSKVRLLLQYEYEIVSGFHVLKRLTQTYDDVKLTLEFKTKVEAAQK